MMRPPFPLVIDNTMRSSFIACPKKFYYEFIRKLTPYVISPDLHAGGAFAKGIETVRMAYYRDHLPLETALARGMEAFTHFWGKYNPPEGHVKTYEAMLAALVEYFHQYHPEYDVIQPYMVEGGKPAVEFNFALPFPTLRHPESGEPLIYAGRFDLLGVYQDQLFIVDEKTTKQLGPSWPEQWHMKSQFTGYAWGARAFGYPVAGAIIRGMSVLKNSFGHAQVILYRPEWVIDRWLHQLERDVKRMIAAWEEGYWDYDINDACSAYGGCPFKLLCGSENPERWIEGNYAHKNWNPLAADPTESKLAIEASVEQ